MRIRCEALRFAFGDLAVFDGFDMAFPENTVTAVLGPSGCGKTTLFNLISGALRPDAGTVRIGNGTMRAGGARIARLFQEPRLLPWITVRRNVELVLETVRDKRQRAETARKFIAAVGLSDFQDARPDALSGGMRQRAAIARAFAYPADIMLLDEPFQALDLRRKLALVDLFLGLWKNVPRTTLFVTHDIQEAQLLGDRIVVLSDRPARLLGAFENPLPAARRNLSDERLAALGRDLYRLIAG